VKYLEFKINSIYENVQEKAKKLNSTHGAIITIGLAGLNK